MTIPEHIMTGVAILVKQQGHEVFTRQEVSDQLAVDHPRWQNSYNPIFQGMRVDHPGGAPQVNERFQGVFRRVSHGKYKLTDYGKTLLNEF